MQSAGRPSSVSGYGPGRPRWTRLFSRDSLARRLDWPILLAALTLSLIGSLLVYSATRNRTAINQGDPHYFLIRHRMNLGIGFVLMIGTIWLGHRALRNAVPMLYGISVLGVLLVLTPLGATINGNRNWIVLGTVHRDFPALSDAARRCTATRPTRTTPTGGWSAKALSPVPRGCGRTPWWG